MSEQPNPYEITEATIEEPPTRFFQKLKYLGPGFILSASIVGSGELIATTAFGAQAGMTLLWVILFSCLVKVTLQLEFGKHAIHSGETTMEAFNKLPGWAPGRVNWSIWLWLALMVLKFLQVGAIIGLVAEIANIAFPGTITLTQSITGIEDAAFAAKIAEAGWCALFAAIVSLLIFRGKYKVIERLSLVLIGLFTLMTLGSLIMLQNTDFAVEGGNVIRGLIPNLPNDMKVLFYAIGAFGITGVGGDEIMHYNYWLLEKGYAKKTGPSDKDNPDWQRRAKGWISVMYLDAIAAMIVYTVMTAAFFILGAAILHGAEDLPSGGGLIERLSVIYTETLGPWAKTAFMTGAFVVLFSTLFSALGAWTRGFADCFGQLRLLDFRDNKQRGKAIAWLAWVIPVIWSIVYFAMGKPLFMVYIGGASTTAMLLIVIVAAIHFRYRRLVAPLRPGKLYDVCFWTSAIAILLVGIWALVKPFVT
ncbi:MAG: Nramp family divalent metal transporter [Verrucomicrobiales bacterium]|nr:Nramp family divalent metal transporter [Verrucomicrobiales bacterium]